MSQNNNHNEPGSAGSRRAWTKRFTLQSGKTRVALIVAAFALYALASFALNRLMGSAVVILALLPVAIAGWFRGLRGGLLAGVLCFPLNVLLLSIAGEAGWEVLTGTAGGASGSVFLIFVGGIVGRMSDLGQQMARELAERKRAEEALRESEARYRALAEAARDMIFVIDRDDRVQYVNTFAARQFGATPEQVIGKPRADLFPPDIAGRQAQSLRRVFDSGQPLFNEEPLRFGEREMWNSNWLVPLRDESGVVTAVMGVGRDITERKRIEEAEREQRALAEALRDTAAALTSTLSFDEVLDRILIEVGRVVPHDAARILLVEDGVASTVRSRGYAEQEPAAPILTPPALIDATVNLRAMLQTGRPLAIPDTRSYAGWVDWPQIGWIRSNASAPIKIKERVIGFLGLDSATPGFFTQAHAERLQAFAHQAALAIENARLYEEVRRHAAELEQKVATRTAELTQREAALRAANEQLQQLSRLKSEFVSNVSHELRTPLTNIKSYLWLLEKGKPEKHAKYMETLHRESELLHSLIEDLLHLSRLDLGKVQPALAPVDLNQTVTLLVGDRATLFADRGLTLEARVAPDLPLIQADEKMLIQVLTNLMTNAMNYTPSGGVVTVSTCGEWESGGAEEQGSGGAGEQGSEGAGETRTTQYAVRNTPPAWVTFSVRDTGPGISADDQARLFERFYRGDAARQTRAPGTGLGLAICGELVERHGGRLTLESQLGAGSTFTVWLPVTQE